MVKRCVISLKRQHWLTEETDDLLFNTSLNKLKQFLDHSKETVNSSARSRNSSLSENEMDVPKRGTASPTPGPSTVLCNDTVHEVSDKVSDHEERQNEVSLSEGGAASPTPGPSTVLCDDTTYEVSDNEERQNEVSMPEGGTTSPIPGPSTVLRNDTVYEVSDIEERGVLAGPSERVVESPQPGPSHYEDISFEPLVTSTPHHVAAVETIPEEEDGESECDVRNVKLEVRNGKTLLAQVEYEFVRDLRQSFKKQSTKHVSKLRERRINVSKRISQLKKQRKRIDDLVTSLTDEKDALDDTLHKFNYFIENFPL